ncbi:MAG: inosine monophosphate cyclohydrolase, partial [Clostridia bacterium]|nr:inosine monophosphate cyclohydrolase [Clostridia bacterium]
MAKYDLKELLSENSYPGRGIVMGMANDGKTALFAYFIMGRSVNSRNRVFEAFDSGMRTKAFDESKMADPSLIIYNPYLKVGDVDVITNGNQTDTIRDFIVKDPADSACISKALATREFEPDTPNYTPRISGIAYYDYNKRSFRYSLSILKSNGTPDVCNRFFFDYTPACGVGHFIHTDKHDGTPIPSFEGEPEEVAMPATAKELADAVWAN